MNTINSLKKFIQLFILFAQLPPKVKPRRKLKVFRLVEETLQHGAATESESYISKRTPSILKDQKHCERPKCGTGGSRF